MHNIILLFLLCSQYCCGSFVSCWNQNDHHRHFMMSTAVNDISSSYFFPFKPMIDTKRTDTTTANFLTLNMIRSSSSGDDTSPAIRDNDESVTSTVDNKKANNNNNNRNEARYYIQLGMELFRKGNIIGSIDSFNHAEVLDNTITPYLWQRGLSYYYNYQYNIASKQFQYDVNVNPYDVEEIVWDIASKCCTINRSASSQSSSLSYPLQSNQMMSLPKGSQDRRRIMSYVYKLFRNEGVKEQDLAIAGTTGSISDEFYSLLYLGLFCEACRNEPMKASMYMTQAIQTQYATGNGQRDYMVSVAKVHCKLRGWV